MSPVRAVQSSSPNLARKQFYRPDDIRVNRRPLPYLGEGGRSKWDVMDGNLREAGQVLSSLENRVKSKAAKTRRL